MWTDTYFRCELNVLIVLGVDCSFGHVYLNRNDVSPTTTNNGRLRYPRNNAAVMGLLSSFFACGNGSSVRHSPTMPPICKIERESCSFEIRTQH